MLTSCAVDIIETWGVFIILTGYKSTVFWATNYNCVTNSCFLCHWRWEPKEIQLLRASFVVSDVPQQEVTAGTIYSFTAFCKVAFKDGHYGAPHLSPLSTLLFRVLAHLGEKYLWERSYWDRRKSPQWPQEETGKLKAPQPKPKEAPAWWGTWGRFHTCRSSSVLTASAISYGVQMTVYAVLSGYLGNSSLRMLPDQETCKKSILEVPGAGVASVCCGAWDNSLHGPIAAKGKQQPMPRSCVRKSLIFLQERRNPVPYCNQKRFQWSSWFTEILPWYSD